MCCLHVFSSADWLQKHSCHQPLGYQQYTKGTNSSFAGVNFIDSSELYLKNRVRPCALSYFASRMEGSRGRSVGNWMNCLVLKTTTTLVLTFRSWVDTVIWWEGVDFSIFPLTKMLFSAETPSENIHEITTRISLPAQTAMNGREKVSVTTRFSPRSPTNRLLPRKRV